MPAPPLELFSVQEYARRGDDRQRCLALMGALGRVGRVMGMADDENRIVGVLPLERLGTSLCTGEFLWNDAWTQRSSALARALTKNIVDTMVDSGEWALLDRLVEPEFDYDVVVDFYYNRALAAAGFHKDSLGQTMFINLVFANEKTLVGPEWMFDVHPRAWETNLPASFCRLLQHAKQKARRAHDAFNGTLISPCGTICFTDPLVIHSTPGLYNQRSTLAPPNFGRVFVDDTSGVRRANVIAAPAHGGSRERGLEAFIDQIDSEGIVWNTLGATRTFLRHEVRATRK